MTSCAFTPTASAARVHIARAISRPLSLQVLALPLLQITAWAIPSDRFSFVTVSGAPLTRLVVYTAAAEAGTRLRISARSFLVRFLRIPQW